MSPEVSAYDIFICFRESDTEQTVWRLRDRLVADLKGKRVFVYEGAMPLGRPFLDTAQAIIKRSTIAVVLIGQAWLDATDDQDRRRLEIEDDPVRTEIRTALAANVPVLPVLVGKARMPTADDLAPDIQGLVKYPAGKLGGATFDRDYGELVERIKELLERPRSVEVEEISTSIASDSSASRKRLHERSIGFLLLVLPLMVYAVAAVRPTTGLESTLDSLGAYYYSSASALYAGGHFALGVLLFSYRGPRPGHRLTAAICGAAACLVALFPTSAPTPALKPFWWTPAIGHLHYLASATFMVSSCLFPMFLFQEIPNPPATIRSRRRIIVQVCGFATLACIAGIGVLSYLGREVLVSEALVFILLGLAWLVKGRADELVREGFARSRSVG
jgi:hypothetical protein